MTLERVLYPKKNKKKQKKKKQKKQENNKILQMWSLAYFEPISCYYFTSTY